MFVQLALAAALAGPVAAPAEAAPRTVLVVSEAREFVRWGSRPPARRPLVWVRSPGRGRVFYDALGHFPATWQDPRQAALVRSGLRWVLRL